MGKHQHDPEGPRGADERSYQVGYGKPPKDSQFKPGQSGNPAGRPKRKPSIKEELEAVLYRETTIEGPEGPERANVLGVSLLATAKQASKGKVAATKLLTDLARENEVGMERETENLSAFDEAEFERLCADLRELK